MRISDWSSDVCSSDLIEQPQVSRSHIGTQRCERGEPARTIVPVIVRLYLVTINIDERVIAGGPDLDPVDFTKKTTNIRTAHAALRQPHHQASRAPVREVEMEVEPLLPELAGSSEEVAPFVVVGEAGCRDSRPR